MPDPGTEREGEGGETPERQRPCPQGTYNLGGEVDIKKDELSNTFELELSIVLIYLQHFSDFIFLCGTYHAYFLLINE